MSYATSDKRIAALKDERKRLISAKQDLERRVDELCTEAERLRQENAKLRELAVAQSDLTIIVHRYWAGTERADSDLIAILDATSKVNRLADKLGIDLP